MTPLQKPLRRAPNGVVTTNPIPIRLMPEERAKVRAMAKAEDRSMASVCRLMLLRGLAEYERQHPPAAAQ